jgi:hypothetical protein
MSGKRQKQLSVNFRKGYDIRPSAGVSLPAGMFHMMLMKDLMNTNVLLFE